MHAYRTHTCGELRKKDVGSHVRLSGWVNRRRDHGGLLFIDLRDHYGITQCVIEPDAAAFAEVDKARSEWILTLTGEVEARIDDTVNPDMPTGDVELRIEEAVVQSTAAELPLPVFGDLEYPEDIRLKYRFLDLRRERLHKNVALRSKVISSIRRRMIEQGFTEFQTPILTASSPEGARDFLVPSRLYPITVSLKTSRVFFAPPDRVTSLSWIFGPFWISYRKRISRCARNNCRIASSSREG